MDTAVTAAWNSIVSLGEAGPFKTKFADFQFKRLAGRCGFVAQYNSEHWLHKRKDANASDANADAPLVPLEAPFQRDKFNFNKIRDSEIMFRANLASHPVVLVPPIADAGPAAGPAEAAPDVYPDLLVVNVSPLFQSHSLLLPSPQSEMNQRLRLRPLQGACRYAASTSSDCRLFYNSRGAFSSVNHLHFHTVSLGGNGGGGKAPVESMEIEPLAARNGAGSDAAKLGLVKGWGCITFVVTSAGGADMLAVALMQFAEVLHGAEIPYNICIVDGSCAYIFPRQNQAVQQRSAGYRMAVAELVGFAICQSDEEWDTITEEAYVERMRSTVSIDASKVPTLVAAWSS